MAEERNTSGPPRRKLLLVGLGIPVLVAIGLVLTTGTDDAQRTRAPEGEPEVGDEPVAVDPGTPSFRFEAAGRAVVRTGPRRIRARDRAAGRRAADDVTDVLDELYTEAFLDPTSWREGSYTDAYRLFGGGAGARARDAVEVLTAGANAGARFDEILPLSGRIGSQILLDRSGKPTLVVSTVRFRAAALGAEPMTLRSEGQFFLERIAGAWRIVSFEVTRDDRPREAG